MLSEKDVTKSIRNYLKINGIFHWKAWQGKFSGLKGVSDIIGVLPSGKFFAIEVKKEGWKVPNTGTKVFEHYLNQKIFIDNVNQNRGVAFFASSLDDVIKNLEDFL